MLIPPAPADMIYRLERKIDVPEILCMAFAFISGAYGL